MPITPITVSTVGESGTVTLSASGLPSGLTFTDNGNGTGDITGTLAAGTAGGSPYAVTITATDTSGQEDTEIVNIVVNPAPRSPYDVGVADPASPLQQVLDWKPAGWSGISASRVVGPDLVCVVDDELNAASQFALVDISDPANPSVLSTVGPLTHDNGTGYIKSSTAEGNVIADFTNQRLYLFMTGGRAAYDISDPANPAFLTGVAGTLGDSHQGDGVDFNGTYLLAFDSGTVNFVDPVTLGVQGTGVLNGSIIMGACSSDYLLGGTATEAIYVYQLNGGTTPSYVLDTQAPGSILADDARMVYLGPYAGGQEVFVLMGCNQFNNDLVELHSFEIIGNEGTGSLAPAGTLAHDFATGDNLLQNNSISYSHQIAADTNGIIYSQYAQAFSVYDASDHTNMQVRALVAHANKTPQGISVTNGKVVVAHTPGLTIYT